MITLPRQKSEKKVSEEKKRKKKLKKNNKKPPRGLYAKKEEKKPVCDCANFANTDWFLEALVPLAENPWFYKQVVSFLHHKVSFNLICLLVSFPSSFVSDGCDIIVTDRVPLLRHFAALECFFLIQMQSLNNPNQILSVRFSPERKRYDMQYVTIWKESTPSATGMTALSSVFTNR